jgi:hypothetical protein
MKYISSSSSSSSILSLIDNEQQFFLLRDKILAQPSIKQAIVKKSAAAVDRITNVQNNRQTTTASIMDITVKRQENDKFNNTIFIHCVHEERLKGLQRRLHEIHDSFFKNTDHRNIRLVIGHRNNPNIEFELARKRPRSSLLEDPLKKSKDTIYLYQIVSFFSFS